MSKNVSVVIKIGAKEIVALCVGVPLMYRKLRDIKLKYDKKSEVIFDHNGTEEHMNDRMPIKW